MKDSPVDRQVTNSTSVREAPPGDHGSRAEGHVPCPGDVGGQKTLRTYWKNYFEKTDTLIWVVDATDRERLDDCRRELKGLLQEEARTRFATLGCAFGLTRQQRLTGASLLVFRNKSDVPGSMSDDQIRQVGLFGRTGHARLG